MGRRCARWRWRGRVRGGLEWRTPAGGRGGGGRAAGEGVWLVEWAKSVGARAMVRCGIALYGYCLPIEGAGESKLRGALRPVMTWKTRVLDVRDVAAGETVGDHAT